mgnify:CR=1 FL=1
MPIFLADAAGEDEKGNGDAGNAEYPQKDVDGNIGTKADVDHEVQGPAEQQATEGVLGSEQNRSKLPAVALFAGGVDAVEDGGFEAALAFEHERQVHEVAAESLDGQPQFGFRRLLEVRVGLGARRQPRSANHVGSDANRAWLLASPSLWYGL